MAVSSQQIAVDHPWRETPNDRGRVSVSRVALPERDMFVTAACILDIFTIFQTWRHYGPGLPERRTAVSS